MNKDNAINNVKNKIFAIEWYVPHYTPSISNQGLLSKQFLSRTPTELLYVEKSVFTKEVKTPILWTLELGFQEGNNVPLWIIVSFQKKERQDSHSHNLNIDTFYRPPLTNA